MTKRTLFFLICALLCASLLLASVAADTFLPGDLNGDEQRTAIDYFALKRHVLGTHVLSESALSAADLSGDGTVNAKDYMILKRVILGTYALPESPEILPEDTLKAIVTLSIILQNGAGEEVALLENVLPLDSVTLGTLLEAYFASDPTLSEGDIATPLGDEEALQEFAQLVAQAVLDGLIREQP